ncbi:MAG: hypothetical protein ACTS6P_02020, partial [Candidatus Hodgkinia cicadicola]
LPLTFGGRRAAAHYDRHGGICWHSFNSRTDGALGLLGCFWFSPSLYQPLAVDFANGVSDITEDEMTCHSFWRFKPRELSLSLSLLAPEVELVRKSPPHSDELVTPFKVGKFGRES